MEVSYNEKKKAVEKFGKILKRRNLRNYQPKRNSVIDLITRREPQIDGMELIADTYAPMVRNIRRR